MGLFFWILVIALSVMFYFLTTINGMFLFFGIVNAFLFFNVTLSTMTNALRGLSVKANDTYSRLLLMILAAVFITLGIML